ncbi:hypothetical protein [Desulfosporosinus sp. FKA]|uniref:hypothetical protein n=1 Tax=Desulfosporosinus sp. FKA TaxID=1969834 RepID=UPI0015540B44|nr:hypothetical protein [Desulfosporosinus sp. FKA]
MPGEQATDCHNGSLFVYHERNERYIGSHTAGEGVTGRNVAKTSSGFRHAAGECVWGRSVAKGSSAFRSRAKDTWGAGPWESRSSSGKTIQTFLQ